MFHVRRVLTLKEREEYRRWQERHRSNARSLTSEERTKLDAEYWKRQRESLDFRSTARGQTHHQLPSVTTPPKPVPPNPLHLMDHDQREDYLKREAAAQELIAEKKTRTGPVYNKGGDQYFTEEMVKDLRKGSLRRRS